MAKIYAVDFDGTLCFNKFPKIGSARAKIIDYIKELKDNGDSLILWTCRAGDNLDAAVEWCTEQGLEFDAVNANPQDSIDKYGSDSRKVHADFYIDDKNLDMTAIEQRGESMISKDRMYRNFEIRADEKELRVEGYAARFGIEEVMYEYDGIQYKESIEAGSFDSAEMRDVVLNYNHGGKPVARTKNKTLRLEVDDVGLKVAADLSGTEEGRRLYEEIKGGYIDKMSFAFTVSEDSYNKDTRTRRITGIKRLYDVAAVDIPAYDSTSIQARSYFQAEAEKEAAEAVERKRRAQKLKLLMEV